MDSTLRLTRWIAMMALAGGLAMANEDRVELTNKEGRMLDAMLLRLKDGKLHFRNMANSREYAVPLESLSEASQKAVAEWKAAGGGLSKDFRIEAEVIRANKKSKIENYDDRQVTMTPKITIRNEDLGSPSAPLKAVMMILGRPVRANNEIVVLSRQDENLPAFDRGEKRTMLFRAVEILYDNRNTAQYGNKYYGYAFLLLKGEEVVGSAIQPGHLARKGEELFVGLQKGKSYTDSLQQIGGQ